MVRVGQFTVTVAPSEPWPPLVLVKLAVFGLTPQLALVVFATTCTLKFAPDANVPTLQLRTPDEIVHNVSGDSVQVRPAGSVSVMTTPVASPVPLLDTLTIKPI